MASEQQAKRSHRAALAIRLALILGGILVVAIPAEILLTIQHRRMLLRRAEQVREYDPFLQAIAPVGDPDLPINSLGFRGEEIEEVKGPGTYRIFMLGGSTVYSARVAFEDSHPRLLERKLRSAYPERTIEVQNAGMHWHTTQHSVMKFLFRVQDLDPDLVIVYHGINDLYRSFSPPRFADGPYRSDYGHFQGPLAEMVDEYFRDAPLDRLHLVGRLREVVEGVPDWLNRKPPVEVEMREWPSLAAFERNLDELAPVVLSRGIDLLMASQPYLYRNDLIPEERDSLWIPGAFFTDERGQASIPSIIHGLEDANRISREVAARHGAGFVDLEAAVPKTLEFFDDGVHYTVEGNALIAQQFSDAIIGAGWIDSRPASDRGRDAP